jgi:hypothetical protein
MPLILPGKQYRVVGRLEDENTIIKDGTGLNYGKIVTAISYSGYSHELGNVWKCKGNGLVSYGGLMAESLDFCEDCLEPLQEKPITPKEKEETV